MMDDICVNLRAKQNHHCLTWLAESSCYEGWCGKEGRAIGMGEIMEAWGLNYVAGGSAANG
jgi:hypothetical protein